MGYFDDERNVEEYISMAEGFDGRRFIPILRRYLKDGAKVLELGMGPGKDFELLSNYFQVTGSDSSQVFINRFRRDHPEADLVLLDAVTVKIDRKFDCIYSNKVLNHLANEQLAESLTNQIEVLNEGGILLHTFWYGDKEEDLPGLYFSYYTEETFKQWVGDNYDLIESARYSEMETDDSIYFLLRKRV